MSASEEFVRVGTWLLPETYGDDYDHFTQTLCESKPGACVALFARRVDLDCELSRDEQFDGSSNTDLSANRVADA